MTYYPPTTLLPPSLPYMDIDDVLIAITDRCILVASDQRYSAVDQEQYFHLTMVLVDFWLAEESQWLFTKKEI